MSKKNKNSYFAVKMNQADLVALERRGINAADLSKQMEQESVYFLAKEKKDEEGRAYLKPCTENGKLIITAVPKVKAHDRFEKLAVRYESACIAAGIFSCQEYVEKVSKPKMDEFFKKRKLEADFSDTTGFDELLFSDLDKQAEFYDQVKKAGKKAITIEKKGISNFKEIDDLLADEEFELASQSGQHQEEHVDDNDCGRCHCGRCMSDSTSGDLIEQTDSEEEYSDEEYDGEEDEEEEEYEDEEFEDEEDNYEYEL